MADLLPIPQPSALNDAKGQTTTHGYKYFQSLDQSARAAAKSIADLETRSPDHGCAISYVENRDYRIDQNAARSYVIDSVTSICDTGTCTATIYINGVAITATANSVSATEQIRTPTANNVVPVGGDVIARITSNSGCEYAFIKLATSYA